MGRSSHLFLDQTLNLANCRLDEPIEEMETLIENTVSVRLCDDMGYNWYLKDLDKANAIAPVTILFDLCEVPIPDFDTKDFK